MTRLPPYVQQRDAASGPRFRSWVTRSGKFRYGKWRDSAAEAYADALKLRSISAGLDDIVRLDTAMDHVLDEVRSKRTAGTAQWYEDHFRALKLALGGGSRLLVDISPASLEQFVRDRLAVVTAATVNADLRALHRVFAIAIRRGNATLNPVRMVDRPRAVLAPMDWFEVDDLAALLGRVDDPVAAAVFAVMFYTGLRRSELSRLERAHVHSKPPRIVVAGKTGTRVVPLSPEAVAPLSYLDLPLSLRRIDELFRVQRRKLKEPRLHAHALRHSFGTALVRQGERPDVVMRLMGHRSLQTTLRYWHETGEDSAKAVGRLRLVRKPGTQGEAPGCPS